MNTNPTENPQTEAVSTEQNGKTINITDVFGLGKVIDKLPLHKLTARMAYCMGASIIILMFVGAFAMTGKQIDGFPNAWDLRGAVMIALILFGIGIWDLLRKKNSSQK